MSRSKDCSRRDERDSCWYRSGKSYKATSKAGNVENHYETEETETLVSHRQNKNTHVDDPQAFWDNVVRADESWAVGWS